MNNIENNDLKIKSILFCKKKKDFKRIYFDAFPKNERMPFFLMKFLSCLLTTKFFVFFDNTTPVGFIYMGKIFNQAYILFFAVDKNLRSKGYGSKILQKIKSKYPKCKIVVSIEPCVDNAPDYSLRQRRKDFYIRNGYIDTGYNIKITGLVQELLMNNVKFKKTRFSFFLIFYSFFAIWPNIWKRDKKPI